MVPTRLTSNSPTVSKWRGIDGSPSTGAHGICQHGVLYQVSKPLIVLCWQRLDLPVEIAQWLVDLDANG